MAIHTNPYYPPEARMAGRDVFGNKAPVLGYKAKGAMGDHKIERDPWPGRPETETNILDSTFEALVKGTGRGDKVEDSFSFWDFVDVINPLQQLPVVGSVYRYLTGDDIKGASRVAGGMLYGGPIGMAWGAVNAAVAQSEGEDVGGIALAHLFGEPDYKLEEERKERIMLAEQETMPRNAIPVTRFPLERMEEATQQLAMANQSIAAEKLAMEEVAKQTPVTVQPNTIQQAATDDETIQLVTSGEDAPNTPVNPWELFYSHQAALKETKVDDKLRKLADDTYERELLFEAERAAMAERQKQMMARQNEHDQRRQQLQNLQDLANQEIIKKAVEQYKDVDERGFRPTAGMYATRVE